LYYYLIDDPLTDFDTTPEGITNEDDTGTGTKDNIAPAAQGPALPGWFTAAGGTGTPTTTFTATQYDVDDDGTVEYYGITIDCNKVPLTHVYEWAKYITRRGNTATGLTDGIEGEQYIGGEVYLEYSATLSGTVNEGDDVTQASSGATGIVISHDLTNKVLLIRNRRGSFDQVNTVTSNDSGGYFIPDVAAETFSPQKRAPFGTFAGGTFFGARGVLLDDWNSNDENSFILTPIEGGTKERPTAITITVTNLVGTDESTADDDRVAVFRLSGGDIYKTEFSAYGGELIYETTLDVDTAIPQDVPGKSVGGVVRIRDASDSNQEYRMRFSSWSNVGGGGTDGRFVLATISGTAEASTDANTVYDALAFGDAQRGDLFYNLTRSSYAYVTEVTSSGVIQLDRDISGQSSGDNFQLNCIPIDVDTLDDVYVPLIDRYASGTSESVSIVYAASPISFRVRARNSQNATPIVPFSTDGSTAGTDQSIAVIRTEDTIIT
jgi:hypothetical protein